MREAGVRVWRPRVWPVAVVAAVVMLLGVTGVVPSWPGLPHLVGLPPLDVYTDLRVLLLVAPSWPVFGALLVLLFGVRVVVMALMLGGLDRRRLGFAAAFYAAVLVPLLVAALLAHLGFIVLYTRLFWVGLAVVACIMVVAAAVPWQPVSRLRAAIRMSARGGLHIGVVLGYLVGIVLLGMAGERLPLAGVALVPVSAALTAVTARLLARPARRGAMARLVAVTVVVTVAAMTLPSLREESVEPTTRQRDGSLMLMAGINASTGDGAVFRIDPSVLGYDCDQVFYYSYAGPGQGHPERGGVCPVRTGAPFGPEDTHSSIPALADELVKQVRDLPRPLTVVGHSHSAWVVWLAVSRDMTDAVDNVVVIAPYPEGTHGYLPADVRAPGRVTSDVLRMLAPVATRFGFFLDLDAPAFRQMLGDADGPERIMSEPLPEDVRAMSVPAATDLPLMPSGWRLAADYNACPVWVSHPYLPESGRTLREVNRFLDGKAPLPCVPWARWVATASRPFGPPPE